MKMTTLCYLERNGQYLMLHRTKKVGDENHDKWIGVGGKFENAESPEDCMKREILEETGLTVTLDTGFRTVVTYSPKPGVMKDVVYFAAEVIGGAAQMQAEEVSDMRWVDINNTDAYITYENDKGILHDYRAYIESK